MSKRKNNDIVGHRGEVSEQKSKKTKKSDEKIWSEKIEDILIELLKINNVENHCTVEVNESTNPFVNIWPNTCYDDKIFTSCKNHLGDSFKWIRPQDLECISVKEPEKTTVKQEIKLERNITMGINITSLIPKRFKKKEPAESDCVKEVSIFDNIETPNSDIKKSIIKIFSEQYPQAYVMYCKQLASGGRLYTVNLSDNFVRILIQDLKKTARPCSKLLTTNAMWVNFSKGHVYHEHSEKKYKCRCFLDLDMNWSGGELDSFKNQVEHSFRSFVEYLRNSLRAILLEKCDKNHILNNERNDGRPSVITSIWDASKLEKMSKHAIIKTSEDCIMFGSKYDVGIFVYRCASSWILSKLCNSKERSAGALYISKVEAMITMVRNLDFGIYNKSGEFRLPLCTKTGEIRHLKPEMYETMLLSCEGGKYSNFNFDTIELKSKTTIVNNYKSGGGREVIIRREYDQTNRIFFTSLDEKVDTRKIDRASLLLPAAKIENLTPNENQSKKTISSDSKIQDDIFDSLLTMCRDDRKGDLILYSSTMSKKNDLDRRVGVSNGVFSETIFLEDLMFDSMISPTIKYDNQRILSMSGTILISFSKIDCDGFFEKIKLLGETLREITAEIDKKRAEDREFRRVYQLLLYHGRSTCVNLYSLFDKFSNMWENSKKFSNSSDYVDTIADFVKIFTNLNHSPAILNNQSSNMDCSFNDPTLLSIHNTNTNGSVVLSGGILDEVCGRSDFKDWLLSNIESMDPRFSSFMKSFFSRFDPLTFRDDFQKKLMIDICSGISKHYVNTGGANLKLYKEYASFRSMHTETDETTDNVDVKLYEDMIAAGDISEDSSEESFGGSLNHNPFEDMVFENSMMIIMKNCKYCPTKYRMSGVNTHNNNGAYIVADLVKGRCKFSCYDHDCKDWLKEHFNNVEYARINKIDNHDTQADMEYVQNSVYFPLSQEIVKLSAIYVKWFEYLAILKDQYSRGEKK